MAIAIDASTPAQFTGTTVTITSTSFTPPTGALLVLLYGANSATGIDTSITSVTNSGTALTWTRRARKNLNAASTGGAAGTNGGAEIWTAVMGTSAATTVTISGVGNAGTDTQKFGKLMVMTGADTTNLANAAAAFSASGLPSVTVPNNQIGSYVLAVSSDWGQKGLGTAGTAQTIIEEYNLAGQITIHTWRTTSTLAAAGSQTMNLTLPTAQQYNLCGMEFRALSVATASPPLPPRVMRNPTMRAAVI